MKSFYKLMAAAAAIFVCAACAQQPAFELQDHIGICGVKNAPLAAQCGLAYVEANVAGYLVPEKSDEEFAAVRAETDLAGLPVETANGFFPADIKVVGPEADLPRAIAYSQTAIRRAAEAGLSILVLGSSRSRTIPEGWTREQAEEQFLSLLKGMAPTAEQYGVTVAIEPLRLQETNFINTVKEGAALARQTGSPAIAVIADFYHMACVGEPAESIVENADKLVHCHIAEQANRTAPGVDGDDFTPYFRALRSIGYKGRVSFECRWNDLEKELPAAVAVMKEQIAKVK